MDPEILATARMQFIKSGEMFPTIQAYAGDNLYLFYAPELGNNDTKKDLLNKIKRAFLVLDIEKYYILMEAWFKTYSEGESDDKPVSEEPDKKEGVIVLYVTPTTKEGAYSEIQREKFTNKFVSLLPPETLDAVEGPFTELLPTKEVKNKFKSLPVDRQQELKAHILEDLGVEIKNAKQT